MRFEQLTLPGMPPERTTDGQIITPWRSRWFVIQHTATGRYLATNATTGRLGFTAYALNEKEVHFFNSAISANEMVRVRSNCHAVELTPQQIAELGLS